MNFNKNSVVTFCWNLINFLMEKRNGIENDIKDVWVKKKKLSVITPVLLDYCIILACIYIRIFLMEKFKNI